MGSVTGESRITYDARGLSEPHAEVPQVSEIQGETASFDAHDLSTRQINLELRWLLYEQGINEVTVRNPGSATSAAVSSTGRRSGSPAASAGRRART